MNKPAAAKWARYLAERARGVGRVNAVRHAGYDPRTRRSALSIANQIEKKLIASGVIERSLLDVGLTLQEAAQAVRRAIKSRNARTACQAVKLVGQWMGWNRHPRQPGERAPNPGRCRPEPDAR
jgi:hypothetical protein